MYEDAFLLLPNDKERMAFLEHYTDSDHWYCEKVMAQYDRRFWTHPGDGYTLYVEDELQTVFYPEKSEKWISKSIFLVPADEPKKPLADFRASKTQIINWIKEKRRKEAEP